MCRLISYVVPEGPPYFAGGPARGVTKCEEHNWIIDARDSIKKAFEEVYREGYEAGQIAGPRREDMGR